MEKSYTRTSYEFRLGANEADLLDKNLHDKNFEIEDENIQILLFDNLEAYYGVDLVSYGFDEDEKGMVIAITIDHILEQNKFKKILDQWFEDLKRKDNCCFKPNIKIKGKPLFIFGFSLNFIEKEILDGFDFIITDECSDPKLEEISLKSPFDWFKENHIKLVEYGKDQDEEGHFMEFVFDKIIEQSRIEKVLNGWFDYLKQQTIMDI